MELRVIRFASAFSPLLSVKEGLGVVAFDFNQSQKDKTKNRVIFPPP
jgi:hypothetical protein